MADYTNSKPALGGPMPLNAVESEWQDKEPLIDPWKVRSLHLAGIPLVSALKDPSTGRHFVWGDPEIQEQIVQAVSLAELEIGMAIFPRQIQERHAYDQKDMDAFGYFQLRQRPVSSVESLAVVSTDGASVYDIPSAWIDTGLLWRGQVNIIPFAVASGAASGIVPTTSYGGAAAGLIPSLLRLHWIPQFWTCTYTIGFRSGCIPRSVNHFIGVVAAMEVLSALAATYSKSQSASLSIDGLSQSTSLPGGQLFATRMTELGQKRKWMLSKLKSAFGLGLLTNNI